MKKHIEVTILSAVFIALMALTISLFGCEKETQRAPEDITAPAHFEGQVLVADVGSGYVCATKSGVVTYRHSVDDVFIETKGIPAYGPLGEFSVTYGKQSLHYDPQTETVLLKGGIPNPDYTP